jgi:hypothetical protein
MSTSQNGWAALPATSPLLYTWSLPDGDHGQINTVLRVRHGSVGFVLMHYALCYDAKVENVDGGVMDDWGWAFRAVRGYSNTLSNHSSATAIDLNATRYPIGTRHMSAEDIAMVHSLLARYDGVLRSGVDYHSRPDQMHTELNDNVSMAEVEKVARKLVDTKRGELILKANPSQKAVIFS